MDVVIPFAQWKDRYAPLYGDLADAELYHAHSLLDHSTDPDEYLRLTPARARKALGEFYTPRWLVEQVFHRAGYSGEEFLDPACGAGAFLEPARGPAEGWDIQPMAVRMARERCPQARVEERDAFVAPAAEFPLILGNPPWVNWRNVGSAYRARIDPLWAEYGLFETRGYRARLGGAMDDLSMLMTYVCAHRHLALDGRLAFLLPAALFRSAGGGSGFRRFTLPDGTFLRVVAVEEVRDVKAFPGATARAAIAVFEKSRRETVYPVPYVRDGVEHEASPVSGVRGAPWAIAKKDTPPFPFAGESPYVARVGAHSGGAAGIYWVDVIEHRGPVVVVRNRGDAGRNKFPTMTVEIERELVHPLVRGRDLQDGRATPSAHIVLPHNVETGRAIPEETMRRDFPCAFAYFEQFRAPMTARPHYQRHFAKAGDPYWSMYNVGRYTFAPHRVAWREQSSRFMCARLATGDIADAKLATVALESAEEADWVAAFLNREDVRAFIDSYVLHTQISTHIMKYVRIPPFPGPGSAAGGHATL